MFVCPNKLFTLEFKRDTMKSRLKFGTIITVFKYKIYIKCTNSMNVIFYII